MITYRNFIPYQDYYCKNCMPYLYGRDYYWCGGGRGSSRYDRCGYGVAAGRGGRYFEPSCYDSCRCDKKCSEATFDKCYCGREDILDFASFINVGKCKLECGEAIRFKRILASDRCSWHFDKECIELSRGAYCICLTGMQNNKSGGRIAICCDGERIKDGDAYLPKHESSFCIDVLIRLHKRSFISVRNISDNPIYITSAKLNIIRIV